MVFEETITIECFFGNLTIAINGFSMVFFIFQPSLSIVFDGSGPLVERCDGFDGSLWSNPNKNYLGKVFWTYVGHIEGVLQGLVDESW